MKENNIDKSSSCSALLRYDVVIRHCNTSDNYCSYVHLINGKVIIVLMFI